MQNIESWIMNKKNIRSSTYSYLIVLILFSVTHKIISKLMNRIIWAEIGPHASIGAPSP